MTRLFIIVLFLSYLICGCAVGLKRTGYNEFKSIDESTIKNCRIALKYQAEYDDSEVEQLGSVESYETGLSIKCGEIEVLEVFIKDACALGADIVNFMWAIYPDYRSTCYRAKAEFLKLNDRDEVQKLLSDKHFSPENLAHRAQLAEIEYQKAKNAGVMGGMIGGISVVK